ncbi:hypothetical protein PM082_011341 [Marasmius tenuissimus]|nr:hypothetical protein PM082_011341 [Marasmius tenuissimus]
MEAASRLWSITCWEPKINRFRILQYAQRKDASTLKLYYRISFNESAIAKWIVFFLRIVLTSVRVPREEAENTILLHIIDVIPDVLDAEDRATSATAAIKQDLQSPRIGSSSSLLIYLSNYSHNPPLSASPFEASRYDRRFSNFPRPYLIDAKLGKRLLIELQLKVRRLTKSRDFRVNNFRTFFLVLVVGIILWKWTWLHKLPIESTELKDAYSIATCLLFAFGESLRVDTPSRIQRLVESGIVTSLYYAADCYYTLGRAEAATETGGFIEATTNLLDRIATFLSHYCVFKGGFVNMMDVLSLVLPSRRGTWKFVIFGAPAARQLFIALGPVERRTG